MSNSPPVGVPEYLVGTAIGASCEVIADGAEVPDDIALVDGEAPVVACATGDEVPAGDVIPVVVLPGVLPLVPPLVVELAAAPGVAVLAAGFFDAPHAASSAGAIPADRPSVAILTRNCLREIWFAGFPDFISSSDIRFCPLVK